MRQHCRVLLCYEPRGLWCGAVWCVRACVRTESGNNARQAAIQLLTHLSGGGVLCQERLHAAHYGVVHHQLILHGDGVGFETRRLYV